VNNDDRDNYTVKIIIIMVIWKVCDDVNNMVLLSCQSVKNTQEATGNEICPSAANRFSLRTGEEESAVRPLHCRSTDLLRHVTKISKLSIDILLLSK
jgi:hypothetical protein